MNLLLMVLSDLDYKEDVFLALQSVGITKATVFDAKSMDKSLESEYSLFTGFLHSRSEMEGERMVFIAPLASPDLAKELLTNLEAGGIPVKTEDILSLTVFPVSYCFDQSSGLCK